MKISKATYQGDLLPGSTVAYIKDGEFVETGVTLIAPVSGVYQGSNLRFLP
jgi:hypothetical protein